MKRYSHFFKACCVLHNICLRFKDLPSESDVEKAVKREKGERARYAAWLAANPPPGREGDSAQSC